MFPGSNEDLFAAIRRWLAVNYPGDAPQEFRLTLRSGRRLLLPIDPHPTQAQMKPTVYLGGEDGPVTPKPFTPTDAQQAMLDALAGRILTTDAWAHAADVDRRTLFKHPGGKRELEEQGLIKHIKGRGFYRPDEPPEDLENTEEK